MEMYGSLVKISKVALSYFLIATVIATRRVSSTTDYRRVASWSTKFQDACFRYYQIKGWSRARLIAPEAKMTAPDNPKLN